MRLYDCEESVVAINKFGAAGRVTHRPDLRHPVAGSIAWSVGARAAPCGADWAVGAPCWETDRHDRADSILRGRGSADSQNLFAAGCLVPFASACPCLDLQ